MAMKLRGELIKEGVNVDGTVANNSVPTKESGNVSSEAWDQRSRRMLREALLFSSTKGDMDGTVYQNYYNYFGIGTAAKDILDAGGYMAKMLARQLIAGANMIPGPTSLVAKGMMILDEVMQVEPKDEGMDIFMHFATKSPLVLNRLGIKGMALKRGEAVADALESAYYIAQHWKTLGLKRSMSYSVSFKTCYNQKDGMQGANLTWSPTRQTFKVEWWGIFDNGRISYKYLEEGSVGGINIETGEISPYIGESNVESMQLRQQQNFP